MATQREADDNYEATVRDARAQFDQPAGATFAMLAVANRLDALVHLLRND
jgi:hypothetical protein